MPCLRRSTWRNCANTPTWGSTCNRARGQSVPGSMCHAARWSVRPPIWRWTVCGSRSAPNSMRWRSAGSQGDWAPRRSTAAWSSRPRPCSSRRLTVCSGRVATYALRYSQPIRTNRSAANWWLIGSIWPRLPKLPTAYRSARPYARSWRSWRPRVWWNRWRAIGWGLSARRPCFLPRAVRWGWRLRHGQRMRAHNLGLKGLILTSISTKPVAVPASPCNLGRWICRAYLKKRSCHWIAWRAMCSGSWTATKSI